MFRALRQRNFAILLAGVFAANVGTWMQAVAMGWLIYDLTGQAAWLGRIGFAGAVPTLVIGLIGGAFTEHADRKQVLAFSALLIATSTATLTTLVVSGVVQIWMIVSLSFVSGIGTALFAPVFQTVLPQMVPPELLMTAISLNSTAFNIARVLGPLIAGWTMTHFGLGWCFAGTAAGFLIMALTVPALRLPPRPAGPRPPLGRTLIEGFAYARNHTVIRRLLVLGVVMSLFGFPFIVLMPALARSSLGLDAQGFTRLISVLGVGAVGGGFTLAALGHVRRPALVVCGAGVSFGTLLVTLAFAHNATVAMGILTATGFVMILSVASLNTLLQTVVDDGMRARVMSMLTVSFFGLPTLGAWLLGAIGDRVGIHNALALGGAGVATVALVVFLTSPALRAAGRAAP